MIPLHPAPAGLAPRRATRPSAPLRLGLLLAAPHRLGFFGGACLLIIAALWWGATLAARASGAMLPWAVSPSSAHALVMVFGFMPFFFVGFLFTAGPRWLNVPAVPARGLLLPVAAMGLGWATALVGFHASAELAAIGLASAAGGLCWITGRFAGLVKQSRVADRDHAKWVLVGCTVAALCLCTAAVGMALGRDSVVRAAAYFGLWAGAGLVFTSVAHRMIPFFTMSALPWLHAWRPRALLLILMLCVGVQAPFAAVEASWPGSLPGWLMALRAAYEFATGALLLWLALRWGLVQSLAIRLLAMLHLGFIWLGVAFMLAGLSHAIMAASNGALSLGLAPLHAFTMGYLGSTLMAMATRVVCGHGGRALVADDWAWAMFWVLQGAIVLRVVAALGPAASTPLTLLAVQFWIAAFGAWALRYGRWLLRPV